MIKNQPVQKRLKRRSKQFSHPRSTSAGRMGIIQVLISSPHQVKLSSLATVEGKVKLCMKPTENDFKKTKVSTIKPRTCLAYKFQ
jgi:hypothetical protein